MNWSTALAGFSSLDPQSRLALAAAAVGLTLLALTLLLKRPVPKAATGPRGIALAPEIPKPGIVLQTLVSIAAAAIVGTAMWRLTHAQAVSAVLALLSMVLARVALTTFIGLGARLRIRRIEQGVIAMLELLVLCAEAGLGPDGAVIRVARELKPVHPELSSELDRLAHDLALLPDRLAAYRALASRAPAPGMAVIANALERTELYGTPLQPVLQTLLQDARLREAQRIEAMAQKMPVYLIMTLVVLFIPAIMIILVGPSYLRLLGVLRDVARQAAAQ